MSTEFYFPPDTQPNFTDNPFTRAKDLNLHVLLGHDEIGPRPQTYRISPWCTSIWKRMFDLGCVLPAIILISPLLVVVAALIRCTSPGPIIFRQQRTGRDRKLFTIYKFRTMVAGSEDIGSALTASGDPRITTFGKLMRRLKLDELPQLYNVLRGDMSLVGPRPKLPHLEVTTVPSCPGITGAATLLFRKEQQILKRVPPDQIEDFYARYIAPAKVDADAAYSGSANCWGDIKILWATLWGQEGGISKHMLNSVGGRRLVYRDARSIEQPTFQS